MPASTVHEPVRRRGFLRLATVVSCLVLSLNLSGCAQFVLLGLLLGGPPSIEPDFDAETGLSLKKKGVKVAVVCYAPTSLRYNFPQIDDEVAAQVAFRLGEHKIGVLQPDYVRSWVDAHPDWELASEIGTALNVDYVIEIELESFSLHEEGNSTSLFRGRTVGFVHVIDMKNADGERIFSKELDFSYPTRVPRSAYEQSLTSFKRDYLSRLSEKIGFMFYERFSGDMIHWAN